MSWPVFLSDVLDNMNQEMNPSMGKGQGQGEQLPDIIMSQEELNKKDGGRHEKRRERQTQRRREWRKW